MPLQVTFTFFCRSVTTKCTVRPSCSRLRLPSSTNPPKRKLRPAGAAPAANSVGLKKKVRLLRRAFNTRAAPATRVASPMTINVSRLCLGFILDLTSHTHPTTQPLGNSSVAAHQHDHFHQYKQGRHSVRAPHVKGVTAHGEELACTAPVHRTLLSTAATQSVSRSASNISQCIRASTIAKVYIQNAKIITTSAMIMVRSMDVPLRTVIVAAGCKVFRSTAVV